MEGDKKMVRWKELLGLIGSIFLISLATFGQATTQTGQVRGVVKDPAQAAVPDAQVTLTDQRTKGTTTVTTDNQGAYAFRSLQPGTYFVEVERRGFKKGLSSPLQVNAGATIQFDVSL